jgi:KaiC/GvpD/RAD55 family RecA-like ATPase
MKVPTFVPSLDNIMKGGIPEGSSVLLLGEPGAGNFEFSLTSAVNLARALDGKIPRELENFKIEFPDGILYVSFSKPANEIMRILTLSLEEGLASSLRKRIAILDFSRLYYSQTQIPTSWIGGGTIRDRENLVSSFIKEIEKAGKNKLIIIDSFTDLVTSKYLDEKTMFDISRGISRASKMWNSIVYVLMTSNIIERRAENIMMEIFDGTLIFEWNTTDKSSKRKRYVTIPRFTGVLPLIEREKIERFDTEFDYKTGMIVLNTTKVK